MKTPLAIITDVLVQNFGTAPERIKPEVVFLDLGLNSLDLVEFIMALEEETGLDIPDRDAEKLCTVADTIRYLEEHKEDS